VHPSIRASPDGRAHQKIESINPHDGRDRLQSQCVSGAGLVTETTATINPAATDHLPIFITQPGATDVLFVSIAIFLVLAVVGIGLVYWRLHALPEQMAHRGEKIQFQFVAVLGLLALFTHNHAFWVAGLLLALVRLPDFTTPLTTMARSLSKMAGLPDPGEVRQPPQEAATETHDTSPAPKPKSPDPQGPREAHGA
jgi:hypothetical protein